MGQRDTRERVHKGFLKVIAKQPYTELTMKDLASELGMSRQNLYRYYSSKDQILADIMEETLAPLLQYAAEVDPSIPADEQWGSLMDRTFEFAYGKKEILIVMFASDMNDIIYEIMRSTIIRALGSGVRRYGLIIKDREYFDLITHYLTGGFFHLFKSWAQTDMAIPKDKVAAVLKSHSWKMLEDLVLSCDTNN